MITLETERLILRTYIESDLPEYFRLLSDQQGRFKTLGQEPISTF